MKFKWLWFDIDNTLLDFESASKAAFWQTFEDFGCVVLSEYYEHYHIINRKIWSEFEEGTISAERLRIKRFEDLLNKIAINNIAPDLFSKQYLENLVLKSETYHGVSDLILQLKEEYQLSIVTNGLREVQKPRLNKLNLSQYFDSIVVSDEIGVAKPHTAYFQYVHNSINHNHAKDEILIVGDNLSSDIIGGLNFGIKTCWISHNKENDTTINPHYTIQHIDYFLELLKELNGQ